MSAGDERWSICEEVPLTMDLHEDKSRKIDRRLLCWARNRSDFRAIFCLECLPEDLLVQRGEGDRMANLANTLEELREQRSRTKEELDHPDEAIAVLQKLVGKNSRQEVRGGPRRRRKLSATARRKISEAQKARGRRRGSRGLARPVKNFPQKADRLRGLGGLHSGHARRNTKHCHALETLTRRA
jgi:hypothetical protein